jgi:HD-GYP domain-containing protein (c-di-GMP phosphodiesterase class II)
MANPPDYQTSRRLSGSEEAAYSQRGKAIISQLSILLKTARLHSPDNDSFKTQLEQSYQLYRDCLDDYGEAVVQVQSDYFFFCGVRVRYDNEGLAAPDHLRDLFQRVGISGILSTSDLTKAELEQTALLLNEADRQGDADFEGLQRRFDLANTVAVVLLPLMDERSSDENRDREKRQFARRTFFYAMNNLKMVSNTMSADRPVDLARTKRVIHSLVDQIISDDSSLLELTALKSHDQYTFLHSTNVCVYSICLGARLRLTKSELSTLGFSALFHDIGKTRLPLQVLNKPSDFDESEWELMRKHPALGVFTLAKTMPFEDRCCRAMIVASEHHHNLDGSGYPTLKRRRSLNLYSKIVTICDVFDAMTSGRVYRKVPASPEQVLRGMIPQAGYKFDPCLLKVFLNTVSLYPPGTLLLLDRQELALVVGKNADDLLRPKVKIIGTTERLYERGIRTNLADRNPQSGAYYRSIVRVMEPQEFPVNTARYLLDEE